MALGTLVCTLGFPGLVEVIFDPTGPGSHHMTLELFIAGGLVLTAFSVIVAAIAWLGPMRRLKTSARASGLDEP